ncbi:hypothetical protein [uncultured Chloroflexus sp.]|uniref:hypothetical protein n=1 Tax=uncultured Chloroflexus sp. TaxID=214040 RepID=UPI00261EB47C|nr:hypothetical protein [uncultured Chloroflexus sp.]
MVEPSGHCPYLGLKQNQAIRFASPTPEHRCYAAGQAQEIPQVEPDYQIRYCLSASHVRCPLYMGMPLPTTSTPSTPMPAPVGAPPVTLASPSSASAAGLRTWFADLPPRDRFIYSALLVALLLALIGYAFGGVAFVGAILNQTTGSEPAPTSPDQFPRATDVMLSPVVSETVSPTTPAATATATATPTPTPTLTPTPTATPYELVPVTNTPTTPIFIPPPPVFQPPAAVPTDTPVVEPTLEPTPEAPVVEPTLEPTPEAPVAEPTLESTPEAPVVEPTLEPTPEAPVVEPTLEVITEASPTPEPQRTATP